MAKKTNIIFIVMDTVRADHLSVYNYHRETTPFLKKIMEDSLVFEQCFSPSSWTLPSHASMFTGTYPTHHGVVDSGDVLSDQFVTLAEILRQNGYETFGACYIPWVSKLTGLDRGFDVFIDQVQRSGIWRVANILKKKHKKSEHSDNDDTNINENDGLDVSKISSSRYHWAKKLFFDDGASATNRILQKWISEKRGEPFFAFLNYSEAHSIYHPPLGYRRKFIRGKTKPFWKLNYDFKEYMYNNLTMTKEDFDILEALYDGEIAYLDSQIESLFHFLKNQSLLENTMIIITSDHGEQFGERGFMGHVRNLYNSLIHVPLLIKLPNRELSGRRDDLVQSHDIFPTILDYVGVDRNKYLGQIYSNSLFDGFIQKRKAEFVLSEYVYQPFSSDIYKKYPAANLEKYKYGGRACVKSNLKYILMSNGERELYDLQGDAEEKANVISNWSDEEITKLETEIESFTSLFANRSVFSDQDSKKSVTVDDTIKERLKALGYW